MQIEQKTLADYQGNQRPAKLRSILANLESQSSPRPVTARELRQRLERVRTELINLVNKQFGVSCCCRSITPALGNDPDGFEAEMNRPCLVHGRRNLGYIVIFRCTIDRQSDLRVLKLVRQYHQTQAKFASGK